MITNLYEKKDVKSYDNITGYLNEETDKVILKEAYFQEGDSMKYLLVLLENIRKPILGLSKKKYIKYQNFSKSKEVIEFNREVEKFFGFKTFALKIVIAYEYNAWTIPISAKLDIGYKDGTKYIKRTKEGYRFTNNGYNAIVNITLALLCDKKFSDRDIMAVLLHEIGHNFSFAINGMGGLFGTMIKAANTTNLLYDYIWIWLYNKETRNDTLNKYYNNNDNNLNKLVEHLNKKDNLLINIASIFMKPIAVLAIIGIEVAVNSISLYLILYRLSLGRINPIEIMIELYGYNDEKVADNFATMYGFGPESAKFEEAIYTMNVKNMNTSNSVLNLLIEIILYPIMIVQFAHDPHPRYVLRILDQLKLLNTELEKDDLDPEMVRQIKEDIKNTENELNKLLKSIDKHGTITAKSYNDLMIKLFGGDYRELWFKNKDYTKEYDSIN